MSVKSLYQVGSALGKTDTSLVVADERMNEWREGAALTLTVLGWGTSVKKKKTLSLCFGGPQFIRRNTETDNPNKVKGPRKEETGTDSSKKSWENPMDEETFEQDQGR